MKKILLLILIVFLTSGCKVEYNLFINDDLNVTESLNMTGTDSLFDSFYKSSKLNVVKLLLDADKEQLDNNSYNYELIEDYIPYVLANKKYKDMKLYANDTIFYKQYFEDLVCDNKDGIVTLKTKDFKPNDPDDPSRYNIKELTIAITSKYKVIKHNADRFNEKTNTYYWDINANTVDFDLLFSFNSKIKFNPYINIYLMIFISLVVLLVTWISICWFYRKEKINKLKKGVK